MSVQQPIVDQFEQDWRSYTIVAVTERVVHSAGDLVTRHFLRAYDALHLASALMLQRELRQPVTFLAFDTALVSAAKREKLRIIKT